MGPCQDVGGRADEAPARKGPLERMLVPPGGHAGHGVVGEDLAETALVGVPRRALDPEAGRDARENDRVEAPSTRTCLLIHVPLAPQDRHVAHVDDGGRVHARNVSTHPSIF